ncbi:hypothetical protein G6F57_018343 [Rhizopus arrhizus]|nr:hypothetical protein G6F57_018343 [Rhizopus arrhizus]
MVNIVGDHATYHVQYDAPLTSDVEGVARPMSHWVKRTMTAAAVSSDAAEAIAVARRAPGNIATLILPADAAWTDLSDNAPAPVLVKDAALAQTSADAVRAAAAAIRSGEVTVLMLGGAALRERALNAAGRIARATGVRLMSETSNRRIERGGDRTPVDRLPYPIDMAVAKLKDPAGAAGQQSGRAGERRAGSGARAGMVGGRIGHRRGRAAPGHAGHRLRGAGIGQADRRRREHPDRAHLA